MLEAACSMISRRQQHAFVFWCVTLLRGSAGSGLHRLGFRPQSSSALVTRQFGIRATGRPYWQNVHWLEALLFNWFNWFNHWFNWLDHCFNHWLNWFKWFNWLNCLE